MSRTRARWATVPIALLMVLTTASAASAWSTTVRVHGAGKVAETTPAGLMNCTTASGVSEATVTNCVAGSAGGGYGHGWIVNLRASVPATYYDRGWRFAKWVDGNTAGAVNCDPQASVGNHFSADCQFQIWQNLTTDLYFVDIAGPQDTSITSVGPSSPTSATGASFTYTSGDPDAWYQCKLDRPGLVGAWSGCSAPTSYTGLTANGSYTFSVRAVDPSGNMDATPATRTWTVDTVAPTASISGTPGHLSVTASTSANLSATSSEPGTVACTLDGAPSSCTLSATGLADGAHTFTARATDLAGNAGPVATRSWTVDTSAPTVTISGTPADGALTSSTGASFSVSSSAGTPTCTLDAAPVSCSAPITGLDDGTHVFRAEATNGAGTTGSATREWTVDTVAPTVSVTGSPAGGALTRSRTAQFAVTAGGEAVTCKLDGANTPCATQKTGLADGSHTFVATAQDGAGNQGTASRTWRVDGTAPNTGFTGGPSAGAVTDGSVAFTFASTESGGSFQCRLDGGAFAGCTSPRLLEGLANGKHVFEVRAIDAAGNADPTPARREWQVGTATTGGGGAGPAPQPVSAAVKHKWRVVGKKTWARKLKVVELPHTASVEVRCKGRRCPIGTRTRTPSATGVVNVAKLLGGKPLRARSKLSITVSASGGVTRVIRFKMRTGKQPTGGAVLCLPAGATTPVAC